MVIKIVHEEHSFNKNYIVNIEFTVYDRLIQLMLYARKTGG